MAFTSYQRSNLAGLVSGALVLSYNFAAQDHAGGANWIEVFQGPTNLRGRVLDVTLYECTEVFADGTGQIIVGVEGGDLDAYVATEVIGTLAVTDSISLDLTPGVTGTIPADNVQVSAQGGNGATLTTGIASVVITVGWFV